MMQVRPLDSVLSRQSIHFYDFRLERLSCTQEFYFHATAVNPVSGSAAGRSEGNRKKGTREGGGEEGGGGGIVLVT